MSGVTAFISFPNPFDLLGKQLSSLLDLGVEAADGIAGSILGKVLGELNGAVVGALVDMVASILEFFWEASEPELTGSWFYGSEDTPYGQMVLLAMPLLVAFVFAGIIQGVLKGDTAGMLHMVLLRLPGSVLAMGIAVVVADLLIKITNDMSRAVLGNFRDDIVQVGTVLGTLHLSSALAPPVQLLTLIFGFIGLLAAVALVVQLFVRGALIYLIAAFSPLIFAAAVWEPLRGAVRKLCEMAFALIIGKLAIAVALGVSAAAMVGSWPGDGGEASEIPTPELTADQADQSYTESFGILVSSVVMFTTGAFMPWVVWRLLPIAEGAVVSQGVGGPMRAFHSTSATVNSLRYNPATSAVRSAAQAARRGRKKGQDTEGSDTGTKKGPASKKQPVRPIPNFDDPGPTRPGTKRKPPRKPPSSSGSQPRGTPKAGPSPTSGTGTPGASERRPGPGPASGSQPGAAKAQGSRRTPPRRNPPSWPKGQP